MTGEPGSYQLKVGSTSQNACWLANTHILLQSSLSMSFRSKKLRQLHIKNYIMNKSENGKNWLSKDRIYQPIKRGGLNWTELNDFLHAIRLNCMHRYLSVNHNDFWTSLLDRLLGVNPASRQIILEWGPEEFNYSLTKCKNRFLKPIIKSVKLL